MVEEPHGELQIGDLRFDPASGELAPIPDAGAGAAAPPRRLPPQPARLLALLAARPGEVVTREEIREALWPDVHVDFDQALHFCVRQVRAALDDDASEPRWIETLPRRGYRLLAPVGGTAPPVAGRRARRERLGLAVLVGAAIVLTLAALAAVLARRDAGWVAPTVAITAFRAPDDAPTVASERIANLLLERLGALGPDRLVVVGPATTGAYGQGLGEVARLIDERGVDFVIHGRFLAAEPEPTLLVEIIRGEDGAHLWVERFTPPSLAEPAAAEEIARVVGDAALATLAPQGS